MSIKIALVHDYLCGMGGSERVFQYICEAFPSADVYTLAYNPNLAPEYFKSRKIKTTWLNRFVKTMNAFRWAFPIATYVMESIDFSAYDLVISSSASTAKYINVKPYSKHICYCYIPTRALWQYDLYFGSSLKKILMRPFLYYLRKRDLIAASRVGQFIAISESTKAQIKEIYNRDADVIFCPIDLQRFSADAIKGRKRGVDYLLVSRLEKWKKVDYAIEAFNKLGLPLKIIGDGVEYGALKSIANSNIVFLGAVSDEELSIEYACAKAVIFTPFLEYGLIPIEANSCGAPVICYGIGGVVETMIPYSEKLNNHETATAVFFDEQSPESLIAAVKLFESISLSESNLMRHASQWAVPEFQKKLIDKINSLMNLQ